VYTEHSRLDCACALPDIATIMAKLKMAIIFFITVKIKWFYFRYLLLAIYTQAE
jgi:hypothetical protein